MAKREFPNEDPVGKRILIQEIVPGKTELGPDLSWEVVGVVHDERINGVADEQSAGFYVSNEQTPVYFNTLSVKANVRVATVQKAVETAIHGVNRDQPLTDILTLDRIKDQALASNRLQSILLGVFAGLSLVLSAVGIYGVISYSVAQRTQELGIRAALGASKQGLLWLVLRRGLILTLAGLALGTGGALGLTRLMASLLYKVGARDPATMAAVGAVLVAVAAVACYVPARRATKVDPLVALRYE
jgi:putative ABC transport system permease protein